MNPESLCIICGSDLGTKRVVVSSCLHKFHPHCIQSWWRLAEVNPPKCAICRIDATEHYIIRCNWNPSGAGRAGNENNGSSSSSGAAPPEATPAAPSNAVDEEEEEAPAEETAPPAPLGGNSGPPPPSGGATGSRKRISQKSQVGPVPKSWS